MKEANAQSPSPCALTIAGSDSGGGAGIQVDLRVMHRLGVFATTAITAITAQNLDGVTDIEGVKPELVVGQMDAALSGFSVRAIKTGMLWSAEIIGAVAARLAQATVPLVVDPVMVATSGARLIDALAVECYRTSLLSHALLVTPNIDEAEVLLGAPLGGDDPMKYARRLEQHLGCAVLLKGGHLPGDPVDRLVVGNVERAYRHRRIDGVNTHGSGCMLSSAIAANLAKGAELVTACERALAYVHDALRLGASRPPPHLADVEHADADRALGRSDITTTDAASDAVPEVLT